ncbi:MAG: hypothetical protein ACRD0P_01680 [Stackebrandtia sp.]
MTPGLIAITAAIIVTVCYVAACAYWPFGACRRCGGTGKSRSISRRFWRPCRRCDGTGRRVRLGRRLHTWFKHEYRNGSK